MTLPLRDYQAEALAELDKAWEKGGNRQAVVLPTGGGKTVVFSHGGERHVAANPGQRVLVLAHTDELVDQAAKKMKAVAPHLRVGIVKAERNEVNADVIVASVQSLRSEKRRNLISNVGLVIVDECHHATATTYRNILTHFGCIDGDTRTVGFTATLARGDNAKLADIWQGVAYQRDILYMIRRQYLIDVRGRRLEVPDLDLSEVKRSGGDYQDGSLGEAIARSMAPEVIANGYVEHAKDRAGILFAPTVAAAEVLSDELNNVGIVAEVVHGAMNLADRRATIRRFKAGDTQVLANCMVLTEGFDSPRVSCIVVARPTRSAPLYQQMVGRGLRVDPERPWSEQDCLILDVTGASRQHDLRSLVDLSELKPKEGQSLREALEEQEEEAVEQITLDVPQYRGPAQVMEFDPLAQASKWVWLRTAGGTSFLSAGKDNYVFLAPGEEPDTFDVAWCTKSAYDRRGGFTEHKGVELGYAMAWAEQYAADLGGAEAITFARKGRSWRAEKPSDKQIEFITSLGKTLPASATKSDASMVIETHKASGRIDPVVKAIQIQQQIARST